MVVNLQPDTPTTSRPRPLSTELLLWVLGIVMAALVGVSAILFMQAEAAVSRELEQEARIGARAVQRALEADPHGSMAAVVARGLLEGSPGMAGIRATVEDRTVFLEPPSLTESLAQSSDVVVVILDDEPGMTVTVAMQRAAAAMIRQRWTITLFVVTGAALAFCAICMAAVLQWRLAGPLRRLRGQIIEGTSSPTGLPGELRFLSAHLMRRALQRETETHRLGRTENELQRASALQRLMLRELDHRVRNNLAAIAALVDLERYASSDVDTFAERLGARLTSMRQVQDLLSASNDHATELRALIGALIPPDLQDRIDVVGPAVEIPGPQAVPLGMVLHELLTNAMRHGALSSATGRVELGWSQPRSGSGGGRRLHLNWTETDGPRPSSTIDPGCGTGILTGLVGSELDGSVDLRYPPTGAVHRFDIGLRALRHAGEV